MNNIATRYTWTTKVFDTYISSCLSIKDPIIWWVNMIFFSSLVRLIFLLYPIINCFDFLYITVYYKALFSTYTQTQHISIYFATCSLQRYIFGNPIQRSIFHLIRLVVMYCICFHMNQSIDWCLFTQQYMYYIHLVFLLKSFDVLSFLF